MNIVILTYLFGLALVLVFSIKEFNAPEYTYSTMDTDKDQALKSPYARLAEPTLPKYMADNSRYTVFMLIFAAFAGLLYVLFAKLLLMIPGIEALVGEKNNREALTALIAALLLIGIVKSDDIKIEKIQFFIKWPKTLLFVMIKDWLHSFAYIPSLGCDVFNILCYEDIDLHSPVVKDNIEEFFGEKYRDDFEVNEYIEINDFKGMNTSANMVSKWSRLSYFIFIIDKWSNDQDFKNQVKERSLGWFELKKAYILMIEKMVKFRNKNVVMSEDDEAELSKQIDHLLANCYRLISCVVIMTARANEDPLCYIKDIGLKVHPGGVIFARRGEMFRVLFALLPAIAVITVLFSLLDPTTSIQKTIQNIIVYVQSAFVIMIFPLILVLWFKRQMAIKQTWKVVTDDDHYHSFFDMPLGLYLMISILAWGISLTLMMLLKDGLGSDFARWESTGVFCLISGVTAFIACYRADIPPKVCKKRINYLFQISSLPFLHGALTALIVWVGLLLSSAKHASSYWQYPLLGFCVSLIIGFTLFSGKHKCERRNPNDRTVCNEPVTVIQGEIKTKAMLLNRGSNGVMLLLRHSRSLMPNEKSVEIIFAGGMKKIGSIVNTDLKRINVAYNN